MTIRLETGLQIAGRYTIMEEISVGPFWSTYIGFQDVVDRRVVLKCLRADQLGVSAKEAADLFRAEVLQCSQLRHPNTGSVFDFGLTNTGVIYLVLENSDGELLRDVLARERRLSVDEAIRVAGQTICSMAEAHALSLVHGNLGLDSISLCQHLGEPRSVRVTGYGLAGYVRSLAGPRAAVPGYAPPEWSEAAPLQPSTDVFAIGLLLYEMLTGRRPSRTPGRPILSLEHLPSELAGSSLEALIKRLASHDPRQRPADGTELLAALRQARKEDRPELARRLASLPPDSGSAPAPSSTERPARRRPRKTRNTPRNHSGSSRTRPVLARVVAGDQTTPALEEAVQRKVTTEIYGRHEEQRLLVDLFRELRTAGRGCILVMSGASGTGKTALIDWFEVAIGRGGTVMGKGSYEGGPNKSPIGLADALAQAMGHPRAPGMRHRLSRLRSSFQDALGKSLTERQMLVMLGLFGWALRPFEAWEAAAAANLICELARGKPLLLQLDAVELADPWSHLVLDRLSRRLTVDPVPLMVVCGLGERGEASMQARAIPLNYAHVFQMSLGPLSVANQRAMIIALFREHGHSKPSPSLISLIMECCEGNPGFIREQTAYLMVKGGLRKTPLGLDLSREVSINALLPPRIESAMGRQVEGQLAAYSERERLWALLGRVAILGRTTREEDLKQLLHVEGVQGWAISSQILNDIDYLLTILRDEGLIRLSEPSSVRGECVWTIAQAPMWRYLLKATESSTRGLEIKTLAERVLKD